MSTEVHARQVNRGDSGQFLMGSSDNDDIDNKPRDEEIGKE